MPLLILPPGSCGLEYRLVRVADIPQPSYEKIPSLGWSLYCKCLFISSQRACVMTCLAAGDIFGLLFKALWFTVLAYFLYLIIRSCVARALGFSSARRPRDGYGGGTTPRFPPQNPLPPPPPYQKDAPGAGWTPGFWTGLGLGGLAASYVGNQRRREPAPPMYDWERFDAPPTRAFDYSSSQAETSRQGAQMRRSTALGSSNVR